MLLSLLSLLLAAALAVLGVLFLVNPKMAFALSAHEPQALPAVMGGRYLGLAAIVVGLVIMADWPALALAFAIGTGLGLIDAVLVGRAGGRIAPHLGAAAASAALAVACAL